MKAWYTTSMRGKQVGYELKFIDRLDSPTEMTLPSKSDPSKSDFTIPPCWRILSESRLNLRRGPNVIQTKIFQRQYVLQDSFQIPYFETSMTIASPGTGTGQTTIIAGVLRGNALSLYKNGQLASTLTVTDRFAGPMMVDTLLLKQKNSTVPDTMSIQTIVLDKILDLDVIINDVLTNDVLINTDSENMSGSPRRQMTIRNASALGGSVLQLVWFDPANLADTIALNADLKLQTQLFRQPGADIPACETMAKQFESQTAEQMLDLNQAMLLPVCPAVSADSSEVSEASKISKISKSPKTTVDNASPVNAYRLSVSAKLLPTTENQSVESLANGSSRITVRKTPADAANTTVEITGLPPETSSLKPSEWIDYDSSTVQNWLKTFTGFGDNFNPENVSPSDLYAAEAFVRGYIINKNYQEAFSSASAVVTSRSGDCTEHACLLAALLRSNGVPCRLAVGIVYLPSKNAFGYHVWNEAWLGSQKRWLSLDSALNGFTTGHIKLVQKSLENELESFAAVCNIVGQLNEIELDNQTGSPLNSNSQKGIKE